MKETEVRHCMLEARRQSGHGSALLNKRLAVTMMQSLGDYIGYARIPEPCWASCRLVETAFQNCEVSPSEFSQARFRVRNISSLSLLQ